MASIWLVRRSCKCLCLDNEMSTVCCVLMSLCGCYLAAVTRGLVAADDRSTPLQGSLWRWIERNGWWATLAIIWAVVQGAWSWRDELRDWWRDHNRNSVWWAVGGAVGALVVALLGMVL